VRLSGATPQYSERRTARKSLSSLIAPDLLDLPNSVTKRLAGAIPAGVKAVPSYCRNLSVEFIAAPRPRFAKPNLCGLVRDTKKTNWGCILV
jgi:hypothetical protein